MTNRCIELTMLNVRLIQRKEVLTIKNRVKYLRRSEEFDLTQQELADRLGVSRVTISVIESEKGIPSGELMLKIANLFNKDPREIFFANDVVSNLQNKEMIS